MRYYNIYNLLGLLPGAPVGQVKYRKEKAEILYANNPNTYSSGLIEKIRQEYEKMMENKRAYDERLGIFGKENDTDFFERVNEHSKGHNLSEMEVYLDSLAEESNYKRKYTDKDDKNNKKYVTHKDQKTKQARKLKIKKMAIKVVAGVLVTVCAFGAYKGISNDLENKNNSYNVCVECVVEEGDTYSLYENDYGLKDIGFSYYELSGFQRQEASHGDVNFVAEGDILIGRTTKENADKLVAEGKGKIISLEEAVELLGENSSLKGEFKKAAMGNSDIVFYVPTDQKTM